MSGFFITYHGAFTPFPATPYPSLYFSSSGPTTLISSFFIFFLISPSFSLFFSITTGSKILIPSNKLMCFESDSDFGGSGESGLDSTEASGFPAPASGSRPRARRSCWRRNSASRLRDCSRFNCSSLAASSSSLRTFSRFSKL
uniref:Uncharacterized protein n=1 Tax=Opuntia streptacantha TaxID=393608 RepID=A0A7C9DRM4_OPUST